MVLRLFAYSALLLCLASARAFAQPDTITNDDVVKMVAAGLSDQVIVASIRHAKARQFDLGAKALVELKASKVSDAVILAMMNSGASSAEASAPAAPPSAPTNSNDPVAMHDRGVYLDLGEAAVPRLAKLVQPKITGQKVGGLGSSMTMGMIGGARASVKYEVRGARSTVRTTEAQPTFYFYGIDPEDYPVMAMKVKDDSREFVGLRLSHGFAGSSQKGPKPDVDVKIEKLADGIARVTPVTRMKPGEYGFAVLGGVYEFGIDK